MKIGNCIPIPCNPRKQNSPPINSLAKPILPHFPIFIQLNNQSPIRVSMAAIRVTEYNFEQRHQLRMVPYYKATIVSSTGANHYRVNYKTLLTDDKSAPLEEIVTAAEVRPVPPDQHEIISENNFRLYDMVDVYANDGWWFGFISGKAGQEYYVYFPTTGDNIAYPSQEWSNGKLILISRNS
ncbi:putative coiled-coil domain-containing protein 12-like [Capsicum annuum]|nr:putative coiled-coil domain-containing protein 12-like [Capsicum annuum]KAF3682174.1 putative coiled-coil domain-containing protein 12-like [Capsicum annuum]